MTAKKSLGQHWLHDKAALNHICDIALVHEHDTVLEVGPGKGTLTKELLEHGAIVVAVELDKSLYEGLKKSFDTPRLKLVNADILKFDLTKLPANYKVVANIPYYLTSHLIRVLSESANPPKSITLLVQKEVAERIAAEPGDMSLLAVTAQFYYEVELGQVIPSGLFSPSPKVDSRVVHMLKRPMEEQEDISPPGLFRVVKAGFSSRRKTLLNALSAGLKLDRQTAAKIIKEDGATPNVRAQELSVKQWVKMYKSYARQKPKKHQK